MSLLKLKIGPRILAGYGLSMLVVLVVGIVTYRGFNDLVDSADWVTHTHKVRENIFLLLSNMADSESSARGFVLTGEERYLEPYAGSVNTVRATLQVLKDLTADNESQQQREVFLTELTARKLAVMAKMIALRRGPDGAAASLKLVLTDAGKDLMDGFRRSAAEIDDEEVKLLAKRAERSRETQQFVFRAMLVGGLLALLFIAVAGRVIERSITVPLAVFMQFAGRVGAGDLTQKTSVASADELGALAQCLDDMVSGLRGVTGQTRLATVGLSSAASQILAATQQQASGTEEQAAAVQQTSATMEQVTRFSEQISERAKEVAVAAEGTFAISRAGQQSVENANRSMESIRQQVEAVAGHIIGLSEKTQAISEIISSVNEIASESHLLALNAAIEAAAAEGETGRRFSVIAAEVKNLADLSREATVHVRSILGDIQKGINASVMLTEEAAKCVVVGKRDADAADTSILKTMESVQQSAKAFQQISAGADEQLLGFTQVMEAVRQISEASQQTAVSTSELQQAAVGITTLALKLQTTVNHYQI